MAATTCCAAVQVAHCTVMASQKAIGYSIAAFNTITCAASFANHVTRWRLANCIVALFNAATVAYLIAFAMDMSARCTALLDEIKMY